MLIPTRRSILGMLAAGAFASRAGAAVPIRALTKGPKHTGSATTTSGSSTPQAATCSACRSTSSTARRGPTT